jgi:NADH-quinone oxidoreductase subunit L
VIWVLDEEHNMFKMGGLRKKLPVTFWTFLIGAASLSALPLITAGFYSKDKILWLAYSSDKGSVWLWLAALAGAFLTALYAFRMVFLTFFGEVKKNPAQKPGLLMTIPLLVLAVLSIIGGFIELPGDMGHFTLFSDFIEKTLPVTLSPKPGHYTELAFQFVSAIVAVTGMVTAYFYYFDKPFPATEPQRNAIQQFFYQGWDFDLLYNTVIVKPIIFLSRIDKSDLIDKFYTGLASLTILIHKILSATQNGMVRRYAIVLAIGAIITLTIILYL